MTKVEDLAASAIDLFIAYRDDYDGDDKLAKELAVSELQDRMVGTQMVLGPVCCDPEPMVQWKHQKGCGYVSGE